MPFVPDKEKPEQGSDQGLDEEQLAKEGEWEVEADQFQPICQQGEKVKTTVVGIVHESGQKAHGRAHDADGGTDDGRLKKYRMRFLWIKHLAGQLKGQRTAQDILKQIGAAKLDENDRPDRKGLSKHRHAAHGINCIDHAGFACERHKGFSVDHIEAVKYIGVYGYDHGK